MKLKHTLLRTLIALPMLSGLATAATLVGSTFTDSALGVPGRSDVVTSNGSNLQPWYVTHTASYLFDVEDDTTFGSRAVKLDNQRTGFTHFSPTSLADGQSMTLSFNYHYEGIAGVATEPLRISLYNSGSAAQQTADGALTGTDLEKYSGYQVTFGTGTGVARCRTRYRATGSSQILGGLNGTVNYGGAYTTAINSGSSSHLVQIVYSNIAGEININASVDGTQILNNTSGGTTPAYTTFDTLAIQNWIDAAGGGSITLDNISLTTVPQPATIGLFFISGVLLPTIH